MNIIIADDSSFVRTIINKIISTEFPDAQIKLCTNGKEAFDAYMDINPDWLITDLLMPEMSGQQLLSALNAEGKKGKYIVVSADVQKGTKEEVEGYGFVSENEQKMYLKNDIYMLMLYTSFQLAEAEVEGIVIVALGMNSLNKLIDKINEILGEI